MAGATKKRKPGRPSKYSLKLALRLCERITEGIGLRKICQEPGMPNAATVFRWLADNKEFCDLYARAREIQAELLADDIVAVADTPLRGEKTKRGKDGLEVITGDCVERSKLMVDARKWVAAKLLPKKYGKMPETESGADALSELVKTMREEHKKRSE